MGKSVGGKRRRRKSSRFLSRQAGVLINREILRWACRLRKGGQTAQGATKATTNVAHSFCKKCGGGPERTRTDQAQRCGGRKTLPLVLSKGAPERKDEIHTALRLET